MSVLIGPHEAKFHHKTLNGHTALWFYTFSSLYAYCKMEPCFYLWEAAPHFLEASI